MTTTPQPKPKLPDLLAELNRERFLGYSDWHLVVTVKRYVLIGCNGRLRLSLEQIALIMDGLKNQQFHRIVQEIMAIVELKDQEN
jgi:hypothetical protein